MRRVIQLGEEPERVFNFGATGIEAIKKVESSKINEAGLKIQEDFKINKTVDTLLGLI